MASLPYPFGIGAKLKLTLSNGHVQRRTVAVGGGHASGQLGAQHFGSMGDEEGRHGVGSISEEGEGDFSLPGAFKDRGMEGVLADHAMDQPVSPRGRNSHSAPSPPPISAAQRRRIRH